MQRISELFGVNHFIVAQGIFMLIKFNSGILVNPHVIPFLNNSNQTPGFIGRMIGNLGQLAFSELEHRLAQVYYFH